ncbi:hypothetical protein [Spiroplasma monobiae]|nr:hypothetical protein [Spiroplasma monobiae]
MNKIFNDDIEVEFSINPFEINSIKKSGNEIIYQKTSAWKKTWPILFPVCGNLKENLTHNGLDLKIKRHGFFKDISRWEIVDKKNERIVLNYKSEKEFYDLYPFKFELEIELKLLEDEFLFTIKVINLENEVMYFSLGHHPGFLFNENSKLKLEKEDLFTDKFEEGLVSDLAKDIKIKEITFYGLDFYNSKSYMTDEYNLGKIKVNNGNVQFDIVAKDFKDLVIWRESNDCDFICVENWNGIPDVISNNSREIKDKNKILSLNIGEQKEFLYKIKF